MARHASRLRALARQIAPPTRQLTCVADVLAAEADVEAGRRKWEDFALSPLMAGRLDELEAALDRRDAISPERRELESRRFWSAYGQPPEDFE